MRVKDGAGVDPGGPLAHLDLPLLHQSALPQPFRRVDKIVSELLDGVFAQIEASERRTREERAQSTGSVSPSQLVIFLT